VLWRGGGLAVDLVGEFARQATLGKGLLGNALITNLVRTLCKRPASVEVDPARLALELGLQLAPPAFYTSTSPTPSRRGPYHHHHQPRSLGSASPRGLRSASSHHTAMARIHSVEISVRAPDEPDGGDDDGVDSPRERARRLEEEESKLVAQEAQQAYFRDIVAPNRRKLQELALEFLQAIDAAMRACSPALRALLRHMFGAVRERFPGSEFKAVGALICLRLFCPAIVAPETHNLVKPGKLLQPASVVSCCVLCALACGIDGSN
jgi:hypothetical protein